MDMIYEKPRARLSLEQIVDQMIELRPDLRIARDKFLAYDNGFNKYRQDVMVAFNVPKEVKLILRKRAIGFNKWAYTITDGTEKDPRVLIARAERLKELGVTKIEGSVELTKNGFPHLHCTVYVPKGISLNKTQVSIRFAKKFYTKVKWYSKGWEIYYHKETTDPVLLSYLKKYDLKSSTFTL